MQGLEKRSEQILKAITWEYILTGEPVGSRTLLQEGAHRPFRGFHKKYNE